MAAPLILTRYLYFLDETLYSLQESILKGESFKECVYWCGEIYYSGHDDKLWNLIFEFYYNFCAITHPKFEKKFAKLYSDYKNKKCISKILSAVTLLFYTKKNYTVFTKWQIAVEIPNKIYIGRNPKWYKDLNIDKKYKNFIRSLHAKNWENIIFYIKTLDIEKLYESIKKYFIALFNYNLKQKNLCDIPYSNKRHILVALIFYLLTDEKHIQKRNVFRLYDHDKYKNELEKSNDIIIPAYKTLPNKLKYPISNRIGCFDLNRFKEDICIQTIYWYHWEYYCYKSPLWKKRFDKYKITLDHDKKKVIFEDDEEYESFCEKYYYESDEQSKETQEKNITIIPKISLQTWLENKLK